MNVTAAFTIYGEVLEYFDASLIGLIATPSKPTIGFCSSNLVTDYNHERAVADGVNVGNEIYSIKTNMTERGGNWPKRNRKFSCVSGRNA